jgi:NAD(P)-dependent dehydrogenase (short-subunit alcohol dehydrogenase family)
VVRLERLDIVVNNANAPGHFEPDLNREFLHPDIAAEMVKRVPQRRFGDAPELDGALLLLVSHASRYTTGAVIPVDAGLLVSRL